VEKLEYQRYFVVIQKILIVETCNVSLLRTLTKEAKGKVYYVSIEQNQNFHMFLTLGIDASERFRNEVIYYIFIFHFMLYLKSLSTCILFIQKNSFVDVIIIVQYFIVLEKSKRTLY